METDEMIMEQPLVYEMWSDGPRFQWMVHYPDTEVFVPAADYNEPFEVGGVMYTPVNGAFGVA